MILLDIDKAIEIIRNTELESEVIPNLMMGFGIDKIQAEYVAEIKLRNINREYILKRTSEIEELEQAIAELEETLKSRRKIKNIIISELKAIIKNIPRRENRHRLRFRDRGVCRERDGGGLPRDGFHFK